MLMRKTIWNFGCAILALLSTSSVCAQITDPSELYGTYEFTADVEITADGQPYADRFASKCEVTIEQHNIYDINIVGLAGATDAQTANLKNGNIELMSPWGGSYYLWGEPIVYANENGESLFGPNPWNIIYTVDPVTKEITVTDFTAITVNNSWSTDKVLAKFTNCKLTFKEAAVITAEDVSGEYHFKGTGTKDGSTFPTEFDVTLTAKDETNRTYSVVFNFGEDYNTLDMNASFDGTKLTIPFKDVYIDADHTLAFCDFYKPGLLEGSIIFSLGESGTAFSLTSGICISRAVKEGDEVKYAYEQWYMDGVMAKPVADADNFGGTYHVKTNNFFNLITMGGGTDPYAYKYPEEFDIIVEKDEMTGGYYLTEFMGPEMYANNYGATDCTVEGNTLKIPAGLLLDRVHMSEDYLTMVFHVLYNGVGENSGTIDLTVNEDGTCTMGDFFIYRDTRTYDANWNSTSEYSRAAFYGDLTVTRVDATGIADVKTAAAAPRISVAGGVIYVTGEPAPVKVYNTAGTLVFSGVTSAVTGLHKGMYIVKAGDASVKVVL